jgi:hypothetical protein
MNFRIPYLRGFRVAKLPAGNWLAFWGAFAFFHHWS